MVDRFSVSGFRNLKQVSLAIESPLVLFSGANGQGKTNLLEAISIAACGSSFRTETKDFWLPFEATDLHFSQLQLQLSSGENHRVVLSRPNQQARTQMKFWQNEVPVSKAHFIGSIPVVVFEPQDMNIFYDDPSPRRAFLDNVLIQVSPQYRKAYVQAKRVLQNRNHLLKALAKGQANVSELAFWDKQYSEVSAFIQKERRDLIDFLQLSIASSYQEFADRRLDFVVNYRLSQFDPEKYAVPEKARGFTLTGQHRDDIEILLNDHPWQAIASRGEMRTLVLALKASVISYLSEKGESKPLLLLDDIFSELDQSRRRLILEWQNQYQIFLTTAADLPEVKLGQTFYLDAGQVHV